MKKGLLTLLLTCFALTIQAQHFKHELRWSIGFGDEPHLKSVRNDYVKLFELEDNASLFSTLSNVTCSLNMEYFYHLNEKWAVGAGLSYTEAVAQGAHVPLEKQVNNNAFSFVYLGLIYSIVPNDELKLSSKAFTFMPSVRYSWLDNGHFALYSRGGLGLSAYHLSSNSSSFPNIKENKMRVAYQLSPVGIEIGSNHLRFTSEIGYGLQGILNFGLVWHLGKQL